MQKGTVVKLEAVSRRFAGRKSLADSFTAFFVG